MTMERWQTVKITRSFQSLKIKLTHVITHSVTFSQRWHDSSVAKSSWRVKVNPLIPRSNLSFSLLSTIQFL